MRRLATTLAAVLLCCASCGRSCGPRTAPGGDGGARPQASPAPPPAGEGSVVDPYCGMRMRADEAAATTRYQGRTYYFCLEDHMEAFLRDPGRYLSGTEGDYGPDSVPHPSPAGDSGAGSGEGGAAALDGAPPRG